jgi:hypothetical protein
MGRTIWFLGVAVFILLPFGWCVTSRADFINFANESAAYHFFYSLRLHVGSDVTAWLPQGQLITSIQHLITWQLPHLTAENLRSSLNTFCIWSLVVNSVVAICAVSLSAMSPSVNWTDRFLLSVVVLSPLYALPGALMWVWPDYLALNVSLAALCVALFQSEWRRNGRGMMSHAALYGALAGSIAANKISIAVLAGPLIVLAIMRDATPVTAIVRALVAAAAVVLAFAFWFFAVGMFRLDWFLSVLPKWYALVSNPGGDADFSAMSYFLGGYGLTALWFSVAFGIAASSVRDNRVLAVGATAIVTVLLCVIAIGKRPAGTTVNDTALVLLALGAMLFTTSDRSPMVKTAIAAGALVFFATAMLSGSLYILRNTIVWSKQTADEQWDFYDRVRQDASGHPIIYFVPNNHYQHGDVFILLLKGAADFPTWNISGDGKGVLRRAGVNVTFVSEAAFPNGWDESPPRRALLVWINSQRLRAVEEMYPVIAEAIKWPSARHEVIDLPRSAATGHIVQLP